MARSFGRELARRTSFGSTLKKLSKSFSTVALQSIPAGNLCLWHLTVLREPLSTRSDKIKHTYHFRGGKRVTFAPYGKAWRDSRAVFHKVCSHVSHNLRAWLTRLQVLTQKMAQDYSVIQLFEAKQLSVDLLNKPQDFYMHNRRYAASVIMQVTYGWRIPQCRHYNPQ